MNYDLIPKFPKNSNSSITFNIVSKKIEYLYASPTVSSVYFGFYVSDGDIKGKMVDNAVDTGLYFVIFM